MSIIIRDGTNSAQLATVDSNGDLHVFTDGGIVNPNGSRAAGNTSTFSVQSTSSSPSTLIAAGATGKFTDIVNLILTNEGTATIVSVSDGTKTYKFALGANAGLNVTFPATLPATSSATAWTISNSASQTVDASGVYITG